MKILFLNLWRCYLRDEVSEYLLSHVGNTDVFCFQEVYESRRLLNFIYDDFQKVSADKILIGDEDYSNETFVNKSIDIINTEQITKDIENVGVGIHTSLKVHSQIVHICNYHGLPRPGNKKDTSERLTQSKEIVKYYSKINGPKIIGGDFNLDITTKSLTIFEKAGYVNLIKKHNIRTTRNKIAWDKFPEEKQMYADYVFVSSDVKVKNFEVTKNEISDHLPMILKIEI